MEARPHELDTPIDAVAGIGPSRAKSLRAMGLESLRDLLEHLPRRYEFEREESSIAELSPGEVNTVRGIVVATDFVQGPRARFAATLEQDGHTLALVWFNGAYLRGKLTPGMTIRVRGKVKLFRSYPQMVNPQWQAIDEQTPTINEAKLRPIYAATADMPSRSIERAIDAILKSESMNAVEEWFDPRLLHERRLPDRATAYRLIHQPKNYADAVIARRRLVYDELMLLQVGLRLARLARDDRLSAPVLRVDKLLDQRIRARFPFELTNAQQKAVYDIVRDLMSGRPMNRLLQGDVGSGKTVVALFAMLVAVANRMQAAMLAPTEVLATQHFLSLSRFLAGSDVKIGLFTQKTKREAKTLTQQLAAGELHLAVGTQALIQGDVEFANLGLIVVDEQHRFGVRQRAVLRGKGLLPHNLVMTATPIPRTLALSFFADFDVSTIDELPPGRTPIETIWLRRDHAEKAYDKIRREVAAGRQAFVVLPRVDDETDDVASLTSAFETLSKGPLKSLRLACLHGRMKSDEKQRVMADFVAKKFDVLLSTTVIEVGVDVPNATVMLIDSAEQFGIAQLHQLRGRVGRGSHKSFCILLSDATSPDAAERLRVLCDTTDGFELAEADLKMRGPGEFFGTRQSGLPELKVADLTQEIELLKLARHDAGEILERDPQLRSPGHRALRSELLRRFGERLGLAGVV